MSSDNEPTWRICRKAVWMLIQNVNNLADAKDLLNRQEDQDLHIASGKCFILLLTAVRTSEKSSLDLALAECKRLEARCATESTGGWMAAVKRKLLFSSTAGGVDYYDRQIVLADMISCIVGLTVAAHKDSPSVGTVARAVYALRRAWKTYQMCYAAVLDVYRDVYDLDPGQNTPRWPPVLKRRKSATLIPASNIGSRMFRSATTSFEAIRRNSVSDIMPKDVVRLMAAVSVGYGTFNLMVSLLPPTVISVIGVLGFRGNRQTGLDALAFAKNGPDVHAPLAWGILSWYRMMGNTDFMFDGPQSRENQSHVDESEQLVLGPPEEFRNSTALQYFVGRSRYLKGDLDGSIQAYEAGSTIVDCCLVNMRAMYLHELGFMYAVRLDWTTACRKFARVAADNTWMRPYHYFMAAHCDESDDDDDATRFAKQLLTVICRKALGASVGLHYASRSLAEIVERMDRDKRRDHLYVYGLYELAVEQIGHPETIEEGKRTIQKLKDFKGPYQFQYFFEMRCASLQAHVQNLHVR
ncbi:tetratricopeptide repeat protein 39C-like isoform X2 [Sipha flava]|uniref:Tetratricopeptide repeat protein 39C-like isoform X2 n=1 Tax=Sipha flava TaxID=143950 RepID=A0A8B8FQG6_9HEMI|nr:tetratricopeptide repeat protein 39C-like isoform X2 [Sipha flava]